MIQKHDYLNSLLDEMAVRYPDNRCINIVCHGHSVPAGYFATPYVDTFHSYPHLLHRLIKERFPYAVTNVIVTAIGGERAKAGAARFESDVLTHKPDVITNDYSLNDRCDGLETACAAWEKMITQALERNIKVILCTPTWDFSYYRKDAYQTERWEMLVQHAEQVKMLADRYSVGLADSFEAFRRHVTDPEDLIQYLSHFPHPTRAGHQLVALEIAKYFVAR